MAYRKKLQDYLRFFLFYMSIQNQDKVHALDLCIIIIMEVKFPLLIPIFTILREKELPECAVRKSYLIRVNVKLKEKY